MTGIVVGEPGWIGEFLKYTEPFTGCTDAEVHEMSESCVSMTYEPGKPILMRGEIVDTVFFLAVGKAGVYVRDGSGEKRIGEIVPFEYFGEISAMKMSSANATVKADDTCIVILVPVSTFVQSLESHAEAKQIVEQRIAARLAMSPPPV